MVANLFLALALLWDFDRGYAPAPEAFIITVTQAGAAPQHFRVAPAAPGACTRLPGGTADDFCTELACPTPGTIAAFWVQAVGGEDSSAPSNIATCWFAPGDAPCTCQDPAHATPPQPPPPPPDLTRTRQTTPPPLPQRGPEGLNLLPVGALPPIPTAPPIPASGGA